MYGTQAGGHGGGNGRGNNPFEEPERPARGRGSCGCKALVGMAVLVAASVVLTLWSSSGHGGSKLTYEDSPLTNTRAHDHGGKRMRPRFPFAEGHQKDCEAEDFVHTTLKLIKETNFVNAMLNSGFNAELLDKFEASDIIGSRDDDRFLVVFDNSFRIGLLRRHGLNPGALHAPEDENKLLEWPIEVDGDSQFEAITYNQSAETFLIFEETFQSGESDEDDRGASHSRAHEVRLSDDEKLSHVRVCDVDFDFEHENKGIEGASVVTLHGRSYVLALCEGNYCDGGSRGREPGNGRILLLDRRIDEDTNNCVYDVKQIIELPSSVAFTDYSSLSVYENRKLVVTSQENSAVWIADLMPAPEHEDSNELLRFSEGKIYDFPRNDLCEIIYCNIEGAYFLQEDIIVTVSDAMKSHARQPFVCRAKGQSIHVFLVPE